MERVETEDGSISYHSIDYDEMFHSKAGAKSEAFYKFVKPAMIDSGLVNRGEFALLDVGFGLAYNSISAIENYTERNPGGSIFVFSVEKDPNVADFAYNIHKDNENLHIRKYIEAVCKEKVYSSQNVKAFLKIADARFALKYNSDKFDAIFLDAFSTGKNPELWTYDFLAMLKGKIKPGGIIITYSSAYVVVSALLKLGMNIYVSEPFGRKSGGTIASLEKLPGFTPLEPHRIEEIENSTAGLFYRDENLSSGKEEILERYARDKALALADGIPTISAYRKMKGSASL